MTRYALRYYEGIKPEEMNWVLVEAAGRIMPEVSAKLGAWTVEALEKRGIKIYLDTRVKSLEGGHVVLDDGTEFDSDTIIWTAGMKANPMLRNTDLPLDERGRVRCTAAMQVQGLDGVWAAGDCSAVPDLSRTEEDPTATCVPNAQHAIRQSKLLVEEHRRAAARPEAEGLLPQVPRLGRGPRPLQGRRGRVRPALQGRASRGSCTAATTSRSCRP